MSYQLAEGDRQKGMRIPPCFGQLVVEFVVCRDFSPPKQHWGGGGGALSVQAFSWWQDSCTHPTPSSPPRTPSHPPTNGGDNRHGEVVQATDTVEQDGRTLHARLGWVGLGWAGLGCDWAGLVDETKRRMPPPQPPS